MMDSGLVGNTKMDTKRKLDRTFKTALLWWCQGQDSRANQREIARLLERPIASRIFTALPVPILTGVPAEHVCWIRTQQKVKTFFLFVPRWRLYNVEAAYEQARAESDGQYSPHTAFRSLTSGDNWAAIEFVNEFGPLELLDEREPRRSLEREELLDFGPDAESDDIKERCLWIDIEDFWEKHRRFASIVKLWEAREEYEGMVFALSELAALSVYPPIGAWPHGDSYSPASAFPWRDGEFSAWLRQASKRQVTVASAEIVKEELNLQAREMRIKWTCPDPSRLEFRVVPYAASLWSAIWHLFARDTAEGLGWRVCPHCSKVFYPKRKDSYFCEPKFQKLHAANRWWQEHKDVELANRREARARRRSPQTRTGKGRVMRKAEGAKRGRWPRRRDAGVQE
jgi:hypothetical protein